MMAVNTLRLYVIIGTLRTVLKSEKCFTYHVWVELLASLARSRCFSLESALVISSVRPGPDRHIAALARPDAVMVACLQAVLPVLYEMGRPEGHVIQDVLEVRLAHMAAAPWHRILPSQPSGAGGMSTPNRHGPASQSVVTQGATLGSGAAGSGTPGLRYGLPAVSCSYSYLW